MNNELKVIKKIYGEEMMHLCRELFSSLLEKEGLLLKTLIHLLAPSHSFVKDIKENNFQSEFRNWIYNSLTKKPDELLETDKTPFELMKEAGYTLKQCFSESDIQSYKKYFAPGEELCTFSGGRLNRCHVFFAVKDNVNEIKREEFTKPERQDKYGTSVISIQFSHEKPNYISIKNRYNHTVDNPDATFSNDLEKIIPGLTRSFEKEYDFSITKPSYDDERFLTNRLQYIKAKNDRYFRYNAEQDAIYYCENNIVIKDGKPMSIYKYLGKKNDGSLLLMEDFLIDFKNKTITCLTSKNSSFIRSINCVGNIKRFEIHKKGENRLITIKYDNDKEVEIEINKANAIVGYKNHHIKTIGKEFLPNNREIEYIDTPNVRVIKEKFLERTRKLKSVSFPNVIKIGDGFLNFNKTVESVYLPQVEFIGNEFMNGNEKLEEIDLPKVAYIGDGFLSFNEKIKKVSFKELLEVGSSFFYHNEKINYLDLPSLRIVGDYFLANCSSLKKIYLPEAIYIGRGFYEEFDECLEEVYLPKAVEIEEGFIKHANNLKVVILPNVKRMGKGCFYYCSELTELTLPEVEDLGEFFMADCYHLKKLFLPKVKALLVGSLQSAWYLEELYCPLLEEFGRSVLYENRSMKKLDAPSVKKIGDCLLYVNTVLEELLAPNLEEIDDIQSDIVMDIINRNKSKVKRFEYKR